MFHCPLLTGSFKFINKQSSYMIILIWFENDKLNKLRMECATKLVATLLLTKMRRPWAYYGGLSGRFNLSLWILHIIRLTIKNACSVTMLPLHWRFSLYFSVLQITYLDYYWLVINNSLFYTFSLSITWLNFIIIAVNYKDI